MNYSKDFLTKVYKDLVKTRMMEQKLVDLYAEGIVPGHIHSGMGQEGSYVGVVSTRKKGDYFKFGHRPLSINYIVGEPMDEFFGELLGKLSGNAKGHDGTNHLGRLCDGVVGFSGTLGCDAGVSLGAAMTIDMEERDNVSYFFYGASAGLSMQECCPYVTETNHVYSGDSFIFDANFFNSLPAEYQTALTEAAEEACSYLTDLAESESEAKKQIFVDAGCEIITPDLTEWKDAMDGFLEEKYPSLVEYAEQIAAADPAAQ